MAVDTSEFLHLIGTIIIDDITTLACQLFLEGT